MMLIQIMGSNENEHGLQMILNLMMLCTHGSHGNVNKVFPSLEQFSRPKQKKMAKSMENESRFRSSHEWLWRFQRRHRSKQNSLSGEIHSANQEATCNYPYQLREIIIHEQYTEAAEKSKSNTKK
jgi:uncharacterized protein YdiU (UPF0061 family)